MNRITAHAAEVQVLIDSGGVDGKLAVPGALTAFDESLALEFLEHFRYQQAQAEAHASGKLTTEEAMVVYRALGEEMSTTNGGWQPHVDTALKVTITNLMAQLLLPAGTAS